MLAGPDIVSRGFVYVRESEGLMEEARNVLTECRGRLSDTSEKCGLEQD